MIAPVRWQRAGLLVSALALGCSQSVNLAVLAPAPAPLLASSDSSDFAVRGRFVGAYWATGDTTYVRLDSTRLTLRQTAPSAVRVTGMRLGVGFYQSSDVWDVRGYSDKRRVAVDLAGGDSARVGELLFAIPRDRVAPRPRDWFVVELQIADVEEGRIVTAGATVYAHTDRSLLSRHPVVSVRRPPDAGSAGEIDPTVVRPRALSCAPLDLSDAPADLRLHGTVWLGVIVGVNGLVVRDRIVTRTPPTDPRLLPYATRWVLGCRFTPGTIDGEPQPMLLAVPVDFDRR